MNEQATQLQGYLRYAYEYYLACAGKTDHRPNPEKWGAARVLVMLQQRAGDLVAAPPWGAQFLPGRGLLRISAPHLRGLLGLSTDEYRAVSDEFYASRRGFFDITTEQTAKFGWECFAGKVGGAWSGAVFNAVYEETLYLFVTSNYEVIRRFATADLKEGSPRGAWLKGEWERAALESLGGVPLYWVGTDVTALLGAQARLGLVDDQLLVPRESPGYVERDPVAIPSFEAITTVLTNPTGLYFEERLDSIVEGPLHALWLMIAREHRALFPMPQQRSSRYLPDGERIPMGVDVLTKHIRGSELQLMAQWVAFQVHHEKVLHLYWDKDRNPFDKLLATWEECESRGVDEQKAAMRERDIKIVGESEKYIPSSWSPEQFGVAYLAWSLVKGCGMSAQWPRNLCYAVHRQRRHCVPQGMKIIGVERKALGSLYPWGAILQSLDEKLYQATDWVHEVLKNLRDRTVKDLPGLHKALDDIHNKIDIRDAGSVMRGHLMQTEEVRKFAHKRLKEILPSAERYYPSDRRMEYIAALTAATYNREKTDDGLTAQEQRWLDHAATAYHGTLTPIANEGELEHHPTVLDYENTIVEAIRAGDGRLQEYLVHSGYLRQ